MHFRLPRSAFLSPALRYRLKWQDIALSSLVINLLSLALPLVTLQVYDRIIGSGHAGTLNVLCFGIAAVVAIDVFLRLARSYSMNFAGSVFEHTVATNAVRHALEKNTGAVSGEGVGEYLQRMGAVGKLRDFYSGQALATLVDLPFVLVFLFLIAYMAGGLVLTPIALLAVMSLIAWSMGKQLKIHLRRREKADNARYSFLIRTLNGIHTVKALGLETLFERRYEHWQEKSTEANYRLAALNTTAFDQGALFSNIMMIATIVAGAPYVLSGNFTVGTLIACVLLSGRIMQPVQRALGLWTRMQDVRLAHDKLREHFSGDAIAVKEIKDVKNDGAIQLNDVSFSYFNQDNILEDVSLKLRLGDTAAVSGEHGAGKQTLLKLIAGLETPTGGEVLVNGVTPHSFTPEQLVSQVGYLPPVGTIFHGTIGENLSRFGKIPEDRVREMAHLLGIDAEVAKLPAGYDTALEGGSADAISPGLRQRISIARVIAAKPRILLFYNADRALDKEGYNAVYKLLGRLKGRVTMILISNDRNILRLADQHYVLEDGKLRACENIDATAQYDVMPYQELRL